LARWYEKKDPSVLKNPYELWFKCQESYQLFVLMKSSYQGERTYTKTDLSSNIELSTFCTFTYLTQ
jgi:hypothetical protein